MSCKRVNALLGIVPLLINGCSNRTHDQSAKQRPLRVVTWNVYGCENGLDGVINVLKELDADVICLQEAWVRPNDAQGFHQPAQIADALGYHQFSAGSALPNGVEQRMAILARAEIAETEVLDAGAGRIYGVAGVIRYGDAPIRVISIHLTSSYRANVQHALRTSRARQLEVLQLKSQLEAPSRPTILAGDFNCLPGMAEYDSLVENLVGADKYMLTYPSAYPTVALDHIYHTRGLELSSTGVAASLASDHLPVHATLRVASRTK